MKIENNLIVPMDVRNIGGMFMITENYKRVFLGLCIALFFFVAFTAVAIATIYVPDDYAKIQWAINNATAGDTIIVNSNNYIGIRIGTFAFDNNIYNETSYENYMGNYWDDDTGSDANDDGIGDISYSIDGDNDNYPLMEPWENYFAPVPLVFDTGTGTYPSVMGTHNGTIVTLLKDHKYNYTIRTGSYPQVHHTDNLEVASGAGTITCDKFIDANGEVYYDWIPAIKLFHEEGNKK